MSHRRGLEDPINLPPSSGPKQSTRNELSTSGLSGYQNSSNDDVKLPNSDGEWEDPNGFFVLSDDEAADFAYTPQVESYDSWKAKIDAKVSSQLNAESPSPKELSQCLLRIVSNVTGNDLFNLYDSELYDSTGFEVLKQTLESSPLPSNPGTSLRLKLLAEGAVSIILNSLSIFTHQKSAPQSKLSGLGNKPKNQNQNRPVSSSVRGAKGTGYGTGSHTRAWNVEETLTKQKSEAEYVIASIQVSIILSLIF
jgi:hypothetical protein